MKLPNPFRYRCLLAARVERKRRNIDRKMRRNAEKCERIIGELEAKRDATTNPEFRAFYSRELRAWRTLQLQLGIAQVMAR